MSAQPSEKVRVADEAWIALATLQRANPDRESFTPSEILDQVRKLHVTGEVRPGVQAHIYMHNVANVEPNTARYRLFYRLPDGTYRLFRPGDIPHPDRRGKTVPNPNEIPEDYRPLLDWYQREYVKRKAPASDDPVLQLRGLGKEIWADTSADEYVSSLRAGWDEDRQ